LKKSARADIEFAVKNFLLRCTLSLGEHVPAHRFFFFDLLRSLPEKKIRPNGRAENRDQIFPRGMIGRPGRNKSVVQDRLIFPARSDTPASCGSGPGAMVDKRYFHQQPHGPQGPLVALAVGVALVGVVLGGTSPARFCRLSCAA
jgi:hypothetical protein